MPDELADSNTLLDFYPELDLSASNHDNDKIEVVFIDSRVPELQSIIDDITANKSTSVKVVIIDQSESGIDIVKNTLANFDNVDSVHLVSHSFGPSVRLGSDSLSTSSLSDHALSITAWGENLSTDADLLIYGCEIGASTDGLNLMDQLAALTGADVAVSSNDTGHASLGGDWALEYSTGQIETGALVSAALQNNWEHILAPWDPITNRVLEVTHAGDQLINDTSSIDALIQDAGLNGNEISLREAIAAANNETDPANITITLSAATEYILNIGDAVGDEDASLTGDLDITHNLTIEGAGADAGTKITAIANPGNQMRVLDAHAGIEFNLSGLTISGGVIDDFGAGLRVSGSVATLTDVHVEGNESASGNGGGIYVDNYGTAGITITDSTISGNSAWLDGGGLMINAGPLSTLNNVNFIDNEAIVNGGGLHVDSNVLITDSYFNLNRAVDGAGLYVGTQASVTAIHTDFDTNNAFTNGGGVYVRGTFTLQENSTLTGNTSKNYGGGAYVEGEMLVSESTINSNTASQNNGGGIHTNAATLTIHDSIISGNHADAGEGGGLSVQGSLAMTNSTVANNTAIDGAGINFFNAGNPTIVNSTFFENIATLDGGAIRLNGGYLSIENTTIAKNVAEDTGGAIDVDNGANSGATLYNSIVSQNDSQDKLGVPGSGHYQISEGVVSAGFNVITRDAREQETYFKDTALINDIIQIDSETYVVDANLSSELANFNDSHAMHLQLNPKSDAIDAGAGAPRLDAYGIMSNEFVDAGAVEAHMTSVGSKLFWIDKDDYSVYRMNEDGSALQQIIEPLDNGVEQERLDIAYDAKTRQLFFIRHSTIPFVGDYFDIVFSTAEGEIVANSFLSIGGGTVTTGHTFDVSQSFKSYSLAIEETADPSADNVLYIALHSYSNNADFKLVKFNIQEGVDGTGKPNTWLNPIDIPINFTNSDGSAYISDSVSTLTIETKSDLSGDPIMVWGDSGVNATGPFKHVDVGANQPTTINTTSDNNELVRGVAFGAMENATYVAEKNTLWKLDLTGAQPELMLARNPTTGFSDIEFDQGTSRLWFVDEGVGAGGTINYVDKNLVNAGAPIQLDQAPYSLTLATLSTVNTPPRVTINSPILVAENASKIIDNTVLSHTATGNVDPAPAADIKYTIDEYPQQGALFLNGAQILQSTPPPVNGHFTQEDIDTGKLSYTQNGAEAIADSFTFIVSDASLDTTDLTGTFNIDITPVNDAPTITVSNTNLTILESDTGVIFATVVAADIDSPMPTVTVTDATGNPNQYVEYVSGNIQQKPGVTFDFETMGSFDFVVTAVDDQTATSLPQTFTVTIDDVNESPSMASSNPILGSIVENQTGPVVDINEIALPALIATDPDLGDSLTFAVLDDTGGLSTNFSIDPVTKKLVVDNPLDFENLAGATNPVLLTIQVSDSYSLTDTHQISVSIKDQNDAPIIANPLSNVSTPELTAFNSPIPINTFTDQDASQILSVQVAMADGSALPTWLSYDASNDTLSGTPSDADAGQVIDLVVWATDDATPALSSPLMPFSITVNDINQAPNVITLTTADGTFNVPELTDALVIGTLATSDPDAADTSHTYSIAGAANAARFEIIGSQLQLQAGQQFDIDNEQSVSIDVRTTDNTGASFIETLTLNVMNVNEAPSATVPATAQIAENLIGIVVGPINPTDPDAGDTVSVQLVNLDNPPTTDFVLTANNEIELVNPLNHEVNDIVKLEVIVTDAAGISTTYPVTVSILDANEAPTITGPSVAQIDENSTGVIVDSAGADMQSFGVIDEDVINTYNYTLLNTVAESILFELNANNQIALLPGNGFDFENPLTPTNTITLTIQVSDQVNVVTHDIDVTVIDVNDAPVALSLTTADGTFNVPELTDALVIGTLATSDPDTADTTHTYSIVSAANAARFEIIGSQLQLQAGQQFDIDNEQSVSIDVRTTDSTGASFIETFTLNVVNVNEAPSATVPATAQIAENSVGIVVGPINPTDPDAGDTVSVQLTNLDNPASTDFVLTTNNEIELVNPLNQEVNDIVQLEIIVTDAAGVSTTYPVTVNILDANDAPVALSLTTADGTFNVPELTDALVIGTLATSDPDAADTTHTYSIVGAANAARFEIIGNQLQLQAGQQFDIDNEQSVSIDVRTTDSTSASFIETFTLNVVNVNEAPSATVPATAQISENSVGIVAGPINPTDPDAGDTISVQLVNLDNSASTDFVLTASNEIELINPLNHEANDTVQLEVTVTDAAGISTAYPVTVSILNENDAPTIANPLSFVSTPELTAFTYPIPLNTFTDQDLNTTLSVQVEMADGSALPTWLSYNATNNTLFGTPSDADAGQVIDLVVWATDDATPALSSPLMPLNISVNDINQAPNAVTLTTTDGTFNVPELTAGANIGVLTTTDPDAADTLHTYAVDDQRFEVVDSELKLKATESLIFNVEQQISLIITSTDSSGASISSPIVIDVVDINEAPEQVQLMTAPPALEAQAFLYQIPLDAFTDSENDTITIIAVTANGEPLPTWLQYDEQSRTFFGTPTDADTNQQIELLVTASDGQLTSQPAATLTLNVVGQNQQPVNLSLDGNTVPELTPGVVIGNLATVDPDSVDTQHIYSVDDQRFEIVDEKLKLKFSEALDIDSEPQISLMITSTDSSGESISLPFSLDVTDVNEVPIVQSIPDNLSLSIDQPVDFSQILFVDPENDSLTYAVTLASGEPLPSWLAFDTTTKLMTISDAPPNIDSIDLLFIANDGNGGESSAPIYIAIERTPEPQVAAALPETGPGPEIVEETAETTLQTVSTIPITENTPVQSEEPVATDALEIEQARQAGEINESIDLASLIKPLEKVSFLDLHTESIAINSINREINIAQIDRLENNINWLNLSDAFSQPSDIQFTELANEFDRQREELAERAAENKTLIGSSFTLSSGLSVGYLLWLIRGGTLMGSVLSSLPAWRLVDPLPVLGSLGDDLDDDDESLESMVDNVKREAELKKPPAQAA